MNMFREAVKKLVSTKLPFYHKLQGTLFVKTLERGDNHFIFIEILKIY